jgi:hypothetical protein
MTLKPGHDPAQIIRIMLSALVNDEVVAARARELRGRIFSIEAEALDLLDDRIPLFGTAQEVADILVTLLAECRVITLADVEQATARTQLPRWRWPYGIWVCDDGREVLFDRHYRPIFERRLGQPVTAADSREWVHWKDQQWFYDDGTPRRERYRAVKAVLDAWGIEAPTLKH